MAGRSRRKPTRPASRRRPCAVSSRNAPHGGPRAPRIEARVRHMIDTDDGFLPLLSRRVQEDPTALFARYEGMPITFGELDRMASALAIWMRGHGLKPGGAVALMIRNSPVALALLFATARARAVWVPIKIGRA